MYKMKIFFEKIIKIFKYIVLLWHDEDWDYAYLLYIIEFKLKRMKNNLNEYYIDGHGKRIEVSKQIDKTLGAINKYNNEYELFPMIDPEELYNIEMFWKRNSNRNTSSMCYMFEDGKEVPENHEFFEYKNKYINRIYNWKNAAWNRIFDTIKKHGQYWWD